MSILHPYTEAEFEKLVLDNLPMLRGLAMRILRNGFDVDDAIQTALLKAWTRRFLLREQSRIIGWIARIVINESYTILRIRQKNNTVPLDRETSELAEEDSTDANQLQCLETKIAELPELYRQTVHIAILSGLDTSQAAKLLGCSENTLYQRIHKAKILLREAMKHE